MNVPFFPESASTGAAEVDAIFFVLLGLGLLFSLGIAALITVFVIRYRHGNENADRSNPINENRILETGWIVIPLLMGLGVFVWASFAYYRLEEPPPGEMHEVYATGKQWMWKFQHPNGVREINTLHVPLGRRVRMNMSSEDVIHSFYVPAFRIKQDVLPGRTTTVWFEATKTGRFRLFCAEFCGTEHSYMGGFVVVMDPAEYEAWLQTGDTAGRTTMPGTGVGEPVAPDDVRYRADPQDAGRTDVSPEPWLLQNADREAPAVDRGPVSMAAAGAALFERLRCVSCHRPDSTALYPAQGPSLYRLFGSRVQIGQDRFVLADEQYLRESIVYPYAKLVAGYPPIMPTFKGQLSEEELNQLVAYLKSLGAHSSAPARPVALDSVAAASPPPTR